jgi:hypothetical protein
MDSILIPSLFVDPWWCDTIIVKTEGSDKALADL